jgi:hypothetical protein
LTGVTTIYVYTWAFYAYLLVVPAAGLAIGWTAYKYGYGKGRLDEKQAQNPIVKATRFRQRTAEADPRRHAVVRTARMIARRQPRPEPRRGKPRDS